MGKFGGRELNYHSDLDVVFLYEAEGMTVQSRRSQARRSHDQPAFLQRAGAADHQGGRPKLGPFGRLYEIDPRLRPTGRAARWPPASAEFSQYFAEGQGQLWERQALCKARVVFAPPGGAAARRWRRSTKPRIAPLWQAGDAEIVQEMRRRMERTAPSGNMKRGPGGLVDIEFLVQMLQLKYGHDDPSLRVAGTFEALSALHAAGHMSRDDYEFFNDSYRFLRTLQARLRLMSPIARDSLPEDAARPGAAGGPAGLQVGHGAAFGL